VQSIGLQCAWCAYELKRKTEARKICWQEARSVLGGHDIDENLERQGSAFVELLGSELDGLEQPLTKDVQYCVAIGWQVAHLSLLVRDTDLEVLVDQHLDTIHECQENAGICDGLVGIAKNVWCLYVDATMLVGLVYEMQTTEKGESKSLLHTKHSMLSIECKLVIASDGMDRIIAMMNDRMID
jgi:hypothetical protein